MFRLIFLGSKQNKINTHQAKKKSCTQLNYFFFSSPLRTMITQCEQNFFAY